MPYAGAETGTPGEGNAHQEPTKKAESGWASGSAKNDHGIRKGLAERNQRKRKKGTRTAATALGLPLGFFRLFSFFSATSCT
jgi:hypothetical protein